MILYQLLMQKLDSQEPTTGLFDEYKIRWGWGHGSMEVNGKKLATYPLRRRAGFFKSEPTPYVIAVDYPGLDVYLRRTDQEKQKAEPNNMTCFSDISFKFLFGFIANTRRHNARTAAEYVIPSQKHKGELRFIHTQNRQLP